MLRIGLFILTAAVVKDAEDVFGVLAESIVNKPPAQELLKGDVLNVERALAPVVCNGGAICVLPRVLGDPFPGGNGEALAPVSKVAEPVVARTTGREQHHIARCRAIDGPRKRCRKVRQWC